jgi:hypothetical protein
MNIQILPNGNLKMTADSKERAFIKYLKLVTTPELNGYAQEAAFLAQFLRPQYTQTSAASVGALTDAPLITDGINVWGHMNYQVEDFLETLASGEPSVWQKG